MGWVWPSQARECVMLTWCMPGACGEHGGWRGSMGRGEHVGRGSLSMGRGSMGRRSMGRGSMWREGAWGEGALEEALGEREHWERELRRGS